MIFSLMLLILLLSPFQSMINITQASTDHTTSLSYTYSFDTPILERISFLSSQITRITLDQLSISNRYGKPILPEKQIKLLLPYQTSIKNIQITPRYTQIMKSPLLQDLEIGLGSRSFSEHTMSFFKDIPLLFDETTYYPEQNFELIDIQYKHGYAILYLDIFPVQYHKMDNRIKYANEIQIEIETEPMNQKNSVFNPLMKNQISQEIENPEILETYDTSAFTYTSDETYDYIIITSEELADCSENHSYSFQDLIDYRQDQGLSCLIKTIEEIQDEYDGIDLQEKIRNFVKEAYSNYNTQWVLLGGDVEIVPVRYLKDIDGKETDETELASDIYYQCLDGNYNYDGDEIWGEEFDGVDGNRIDLLAEVYVGRAPVDDEMDVSSFVEKTLSYEQSDWEESPYVRNVLSAGQRVWDGPGGYGAGYLERCIDFCDEYGQQTYGIPTDNFEITELYERDMDWVDDDVIDVIDNGVSIINHVGHGSSFAVMKLTTYELNQLNNAGKYGLFYSAACHSGEIDQDDCFAEEWVNIPQKGGFAAIMNTGYGYGSVSDYDGADNRYAREFFDALFSPDEQKSRIGVANQDSKEDNIWHIHEDNMFHCYYSTMLFGDPYVSIKGAEEASADFSWNPAYPKTNEIISFVDQSDGIIIYRRWDFGDGESSFVKNPSHVFTTNKIYQVTLTVMDDQGYRSTTSYEIDVRDYWNPIPIISPSDSNIMDATVQFSAAASWDPDGSIVSYDWDFGDDTHSDLIEPVHTYPEDGTYEVSLLIEDDDGNVARAYSTIVLLQQYPPSVPVVTGPSTTFSGDQTSFSMVATDPEGDDIKYGIIWGDDEIEWTEWFSSGEPCTIHHQWIQPGDHEVKVKATDSHFGSSNWSESLIVYVEDESDPTLEIQKPLNGVYLKNEKIIPFFTPLVFGDIDIYVNASDASGIKKVFFYIDDMIKPVAEVLHPPFHFTWDTPSYKRHSIKIVAEDNAGKQSINEFDLWKFF